MRGTLIRAVSRPEIDERVEVVDSRGVLECMYYVARLELATRVT